MSTIIDGKHLASKLKQEIKEHIANSNMIQKIGLAVVIVGDDAASQIYVKNKLKACQDVGIRSVVHRLPPSVTQQELEDLLNKLNDDTNIHGILVQLPLPKHIDSYKISNTIIPQKDVDGLSDITAVKLFRGQECLMPCTPHGLIRLIQSTGVDIAGKHAVVLGRSDIVGKPISQLLLNHHATVTICHSRTSNVYDLTRQADILVVAIGKKHFIKRDDIKQNAIILDVGINRDNNKIYGDVDFDSVFDKASFVTPVPGGVGPMTVACLMYNVMRAARIG